MHSLQWDQWINEVIKANQRLYLSIYMVYIIIYLTDLVQYTTFMQNLENIISNHMLEKINQD